MSGILHLGTRALQTQRHEHPAGTGFTRSLNTDHGLSKRVISNATFTASNGRITGANGDFANFAAGDPILILSSNLNSGEFIVTGIDATNHAYLVLDPAPKNEGPISVEVRTP